jgi:hypothetical protein
VETLYNNNNNACQRGQVKILLPDCPLLHWKILLIEYIYLKDFLGYMYEISKISRQNIKKVSDKQHTLKKRNLLVQYCKAVL